MINQLTTFIAEQNFSSYEDLKTFFENEPYNCIVKDDDSDLFMISYTIKSDLSNEIIRECNGVIFEKETFKLKHSFFGKTYDSLEDFNGSGITTSDPFTVKDLSNNVKIGLYFEGSIIKLYYHLDEWKMSTSRCFNASTTFWNMNLKTFDDFDISFGEMFIEAINNIYPGGRREFFKTLNPDCCYTYLLQHPMGSGIIYSDIPNTFELNHYNLLEEVLVENTDCLDDKILSNVTVDSLKNKSKLNENYILYNMNHEGVVTSRVKLLNDRYCWMTGINEKRDDLAAKFLELLKRDDKELIPYMYYKFQRLTKVFDLLSSKIAKKCKRLDHLILNDERGSPNEEYAIDLIKSSRLTPSHKKLPTRNVILENLSTQEIFDLVSFVSKK